MGDSIRVADVIVRLLESGNSRILDPLFLFHELNVLVLARFYCAFIGS